MPAGREPVTFADRSIGSFADDVASTAVTPSGGAVAAIGGAMGAALVEMVCIHTIENDEHDAPAELADVRDDLAAGRARLLELADDDAAAVEELQAVTRSDRDTARSEREALERATDVPLATAATCADVVEVAATVAAAGAEHAVADVATGAYLAHAGVRASASTVRANLAFVDDDEFAASAETRATDARTRADAALERVETALERVT